tara:strand:- start:13423 stop:14253 length:831 start_codon:yes stop_codon:yes gene_type:complete
MKNKHNKKRNTAFLYEILVRETTKAVISKNTARKELATRIIKENFKKNSALYKELQLYKAILDTTSLDDRTSERLLNEVKVSRGKIDNKNLFNEQTNLIQKINKNLGPDIFSNFLPNYKSMATVSQLFSDSINVKDRVMLEQLILKNLQSEDIQEEEKLEYIDNLVFKTFVEKFNDAYGEKLTEQQKSLVINYVFSFTDNAVGLKSYLNEEIGRLKEEVNASLQHEDIQADEHMIEKTNNVIKFLESLSKRKTTEDDIQKILKIQTLVQEVSNNGN